ncbi:phytoene desaturase family protein [Mycobacterium sp. 23]|uniref:phytoene desaturase family protein n=1 Tax=Mycobacterium sp. 23 TaxID=3400424 RepID=UPI003AAC2B54
MADADFDAVIIGGGHNGLVATAYLARAGLRVRLLERLPHIGGATISAQVFDGVDVRLSRYSYLVSLLPTRILEDLGARVRLARRPYSSYTPDPGTSGRTGLLVGQNGSFAAIGAAEDERRFAAFYRRCGQVTGRLWPTLLEPLRTREQARQLVLDGGSSDGMAAWHAMVEEPIGHAITDAVTSDVVRGVMATDALVGTFARLNDTSLLQNICFLYHVLGGGTGDWNVPVGGMGAVSSALAAAATRHGAEITTAADVFALNPDGEVRYRSDGGEQRVRGRFVLAGVGPAVLAGLLGESAPPVAPGPQVKVNMVLSRLPRLRDQDVSPEKAFGGTFHVNETWSQLDAGYLRAAAGQLPDPLPCEAYCHSLTDRSIVSPHLPGVQTMTVFGFQAPVSGSPEPDRLREQLTDAVLASLNSVLAEPIQDVLLPDAHGRPCLETTTTLDLQDRLGMTAGNIFHGALSWPFAEDDDPLDTPARRWGVGTAHDRIMLCGSGARRGGAVSGIGGHNAAMAVLASL